MHIRLLFISACALSAIGLADLAAAQGQSVQTSVTVVAQREPADLETLPVSVTALTETMLSTAGITFLSDIGSLSPNTHFTEFTARKLSNPRIRGIGSSPANPGVTTYVDGVPQLNANTTSLDLIGVGQVEFVRGPQSALFGRNALGGVINVLSALPSTTRWTGQATVPVGSDDQLDFRANVSGPITPGKLAVGFSTAVGRRDGFTRNVLTQNLVDSRETVAAKGQLLWTPTSAWTARVIVNGERARDGDYALADLTQVRATPFEVMRDFEGRTDRDIFSTVAEARHVGQRVTFTSTTGVLRWKTFDQTDLDYSPLPLARRENLEEATQFTQEVRLASAAAAPVKLAGNVTLRWQAGALVFTQGYDQSAFNDLGPLVLSPFIDFPVRQTSPVAALDDTGLGLYGQATLGLSSRVAATVGARFDHETKDADILSGLIPQIAPDVRTVETRDYSDVSPQLAVTVRLNPNALVFGNVARAFKAGGFNPVALPGDETFDEEHAWNVEGGVRLGGSGRVRATASVFSIDWDALQLNLPIQGQPGQFFIDNVGGATSRGIEIEVTAKAADGLDLFGAVGTAAAKFSAGTVSNGIDLEGNKIQNAPTYTAAVGALFSREIRANYRLFVRGDVSVVGPFEYDEFNTQRQEAYGLTNLRAGLHVHRVLIEAWVRNLTDERYIPLAIPFQFSQSGFIAEPGRPRTFGVSLGAGF